MKIPESHQDLLDGNKRAFAFLATTMEDGSPHVTPVWFDTEDGNIRINTARGRVKDRNLTARPKAALAIMDLDDPYRYLQIRGRVIEVREEGARSHIDRLAGKYQGLDRFPAPENQIRVIYIIKPESVNTQ